MDEAGNNATSHKGSKIKSYIMSFKQTVAKFAKDNSVNSASMKFEVDRKRIREWINNLEKISTKKSTRKQLDGGGRKPAKEMFDEKTDDSVVKESFVAGGGWIQNFMKRHHLSCRLISYLWHLVLIF